MIAVARCIPGGALAGGLVVAEAGATQRPALPPRGTWLAIDWERFDQPWPQTESSIERGFRKRGPIDDELGRSESIDPDNVGDIADEGMGHRG